MNTQQIIDLLRQERERLDRAIAVLGGSLRRSTFSAVRAISRTSRRGRRRMSQEARDRIAAAQRKRWAKLKAKQAA